MASAVDVEKAVSEFLSGKKTWAEVVEVGRGVTYAMPKYGSKKSSWGDDGIPDYTESMTIGDVVGEGRLDGKVTDEMVQELKAVGKVV